MKLTTLTIVCAASTLALASNAFAAGNHAHGHAHGHADSASDAIGKPGKAAKVQRSITVDMLDSMRFVPESITVKQGETVKFTVKNAGKVKHEMVLGTEKELLAHYEVMKKHPEMEHDDPNQITLAPGKTGTIIWQFTQAGTVHFACLQPGHYDAGMKGAVSVGGKSMTLTPVVDTPAARTPAPPTSDTSNSTDAEVRKIDVDNKKITLKHAEIKNLDMPGMTMVFQVQDPSLLAQVKVGDKIKFTADKIGGAYVVTGIQAVK
jgi:uncharacterized cupredoxin-like copper-binding protein/Cu/Ag efflux protein CusF